ncbi:MAG: tetratricopeptide repeat protein [Rhodoferax sp.]|nr:tetratricopeptide repeat protein [Rhodoferax sp.]
MAQAEPTMDQVYAAAHAGKLEQAQTMMQQVLVAHPKSAKAHFVQSELYARQGNLAQAREALASAEKLAPGLPFAKAEAVQALRSQLAARSGPMALGGSSVHYATPAAPTSSSAWHLPLLLTGGVMALGYFLFRRRVPAPLAPQPVYANQGGMSGPHTFGTGAGGVMQPPGGQTGGSGLGGQIMGGVATGLAVGAGVMAAEAIGRNLMGNHNPSAGQFGNPISRDDQPMDRNTDMGGQDFGVNDTGSWDDGGSVDVGGGGDWDN